MRDSPEATGARIRARRQALRMTQGELARRVGVNVSSVISWETGKHFPRRYAGAIEEVLEISLDEAQPEEPVFEDPKERELWELRTFSTGERWALIHEYRRRARQAG